MPQLNPSPWFFVSTMLWFTFLFIFSSKIKNIHPSLKPYLTLTLTPTAPYWLWLWV
nr:ATP synthase F0 subunit 8 [Oreolalax omeimontis]